MIEDLAAMRKAAIGAVVTLVVAGLLNAVALWYNTQSFISAQGQINVDQKETIRAMSQAISELKTQTTELKEQTKFLDRRLQLVEDRK